MSKKCETQTDDLIDGVWCVSIGKRAQARADGCAPYHIERQRCNERRCDCHVCPVESAREHDDNQQEKKQVDAESVGKSEESCSGAQGGQCSWRDYPAPLTHAAEQ